MITNIRSKRAAETRRVIVNMSSRFLADEILTGTPTVVEVGSSDLTISDVGLNAADETIAGRVALVDQAVAFTVAGGTAGEEYTIRITATTDATYAQTLIEQITLRVN